MCRELSNSSLQQLHRLVCLLTPKFNEEAASYLPIVHMSSPVYKILQSHLLKPR